MLPVSERRKDITLEPGTLDEYVGQFRWDDGKAVVSIFREGNTLYGKSPVGEVFKLTPEAENQFSGTSREIKDFKAIVRRGEMGKVNEVILYYFPFVRKQLKKIN